MPHLRERFDQLNNQSNSFPASTSQDSCRRAVKIVDIDQRTTGRARPCAPTDTKLSGVSPYPRTEQDQRSHADLLVEGSSYSAWIFRLLAGDVRGLTFKLCRRRRQDAKPGLAKMYRVPPDRAWWSAVGAPLERGVRPHSQRGGSIDRLHGFWWARSHAFCRTQQRTSTMPWSPGPEP